ncbi:putative lipopolysaccharide heptosyltransferase III [Geomonas sp. RF6]|uniref:putative lipopolysaccharide heptosyltransferase III n=1 Tax=Geomonas sp. RF6 TaxID=2897342 RepID=UPI001E2DF92B|nr:putative lipopolysaccharide heptosyltransferase III [Geomonas sp. RF6]UFS68641.1 putative lipopolysaccharide heptosyltransferase III [Geomonas sp. RF6]
MDKAGISRILVIKLRNIGDVLLCAPLFDNLKAAFPGAKISALVNAGTEAMLEGHPAVHQVIVYNRNIKKNSFLKRLREEAAFYRRLRAERFDMVLNLTEGDRGAIVSLVSGARVRAGVDPMSQGMVGKRLIYTELVPRPGAEYHAVEKNLQALSALGLTAEKRAVSFYFSPADGENVARRLAAVSLPEKGFFHAHVTSRWMFKALPPSKVAFLIDEISRLSGLPSVLTCAPEVKELSYLAGLLPLLSTPHHDLSGALSLKELGALSAAARFFVGVDSAPMHMAAALDVPVLGIFGPTSVPEWGPWDNSMGRNPYHAPNGVQRASRHTVLQAERACVPCRRDGCNGSKVSDCLNFSDAELRETARSFLSTVPA